MSPRKPLLLLAAALLATVVPRVDAQSYSDPGLGVGLDAGYSRAPDGAAGHVFPEARIRARLTGGLGLEGLLTYRKDEYAVGGEKVLEVQQIPVQVSLQVFFLTGTPVQPYLLGGGGYYYVRSKGLGGNPEERTSENKFGLHAGAGVDARVARRLAAFGDARYVLLDVSSVEGLKERYGAGLKASFWQAAAGLILYF